MHDIVRGAAIFLMTLMGGQVLVATPLLTWWQLRGHAGLAAFFVSVAIAAAVLGLAWMWRDRFRRLAASLMPLLSRYSNTRWLMLVILLGLVLRIVWIVLFPAEPTSDGATYLGLALKLQSGQPYETAGTRAFWPPGYPFFLLPWVKLVGSPRGAIILSNLALYAATIGVVYRLATRVGGLLVARIATLLLAVWPTYLANAGLPEKENLLMLLLPMVFWLYLRGRSEILDSRAVLAAGFVLGGAVLTQPSALLYPLVFIAYELAARSRPQRASTAFGLLLLGMTLVIAPWTFRNLQVLGSPVLISTSGGDNLYRANNPRATGAYTARGEVDLSGLDEIQKSKAGFRLAREWITTNPLDFLLLVLWKQVFFLGDDSVGVFNSLRRGGEGSMPFYMAAKGVANGYWYVLWLLSLVALWWAHQQRYRLSPPLTALILGYAYFYAIHSVFESASKYHTPAMALLAIIIAACIVGFAVQEEK